MILFDLNSSRAIEMEKPHCNEPNCETGQRMQLHFRVDSKRILVSNGAKKHEIELDTLLLNNGRRKKFSYGSSKTTMIIKKNTETTFEP